MIKRLSISNTILENRKFSLMLFIILTLSVLVTWLCIFLVKAGDVHPNPGPSYSSSSLSSLSSSLSSSLAGSMSSYLNQFHHLSFIHYNVQSIINKLDLLSPELSDFDILAFSEPWLHPGIPPYK